jgi:hypothetical protein
VGCGTLGIDTDMFIPHKGPPQAGQHCQLQCNSNGEVADKPVVRCLHTLTGIKTRAMPWQDGNSFEINLLGKFGGRHCRTG